MEKRYRLSHLLLATAAFALIGLCAGFWTQYEPIQKLAGATGTVRTYSPVLDFPSGTLIGSSAPLTAAAIGATVQAYSADTLTGAALTAQIGVSIEAYSADLVGVAHKVSGATSGNIAALTVAGEIYDSGISATATGNATGNVVIRSGTNAIAADTISEVTSSAGVTVDGVLCKAGTLSGLPPVNAHSATGNVTAAECKGGFVANTGAGAAVTLTLPPAVLGYTVCVFSTVAQVIYVDPDGTDLICGFDCSAGDKISSDATIGTYVVLVCLESGKWYPMGYVGTWTDSN